MIVCLFVIDLRQNSPIDRAQIFSSNSRDPAQVRFIDAQITNLVFKHLNFGKILTIHEKKNILKSAKNILKSTKIYFKIHEKLLLFNILQSEDADK